MTDHNREALIEKAAKAMYESEFGHYPGAFEPDESADWMGMARSALAVFEQAHAPTDDYPDAEGLATLRAQTPSDDERQVTDAMIHAAAHALVEHDDPGVYERGGAVPNYDEYVSAARAALEASAAAEREGDET